MVIKLKVESNNSNVPYLVEICENAKCFKQVTVAELKAKLWKIENLRTLLNEAKLCFSGLELEDTKTLGWYGIKENSLIRFSKFFDKDKHFGIKFVNKPDAITGDSSQETLRAELSCGHAVDPNSLTGWCRSLIDDGRYEFFCPAIIDGKTKKCNKVWPYDEVRRIALLNEAEMENFEKKLSENAVSSYTEYKECPNCRSYVERKELCNLRVTCTVCPLLKKKYFDFCWQCEQEWTVAITKAERSCGRSNCVNPNLDLLAKCKFIKLINCDDDMPFIPSVRACPTCGLLIEHDGTKCKNIFCNRCRVEFCFACLETTSECQRLKLNSHFTRCSKPVASIQKKLPIWNKQSLKFSFGY